MRKQDNIALFGGNGSGKTTLILEIVLAYIEAHENKRVLFVVPDDEEEKLEWIEEIALNDIRTFTGIKKIIVEGAEFFERILHVFAPPHTKECKYNKGELCDCRAKERAVKLNGLLCVDDPGKYLNRREESILRFFVRRRQANADCLWCFHGLRNVIPPSFYTYITRLILFQTSDDYKPTLELLPENKREAFLEMYRRVQQIADTEDPHYCEELILRKTVY